MFTIYRGIKPKLHVMFTLNFDGKHRKLLVLTVMFGGKHPNSSSCDAVARFRPPDIGRCGSGGRPRRCR